MKLFNSLPQRLALLAGLLACLVSGAARAAPCDAGVYCSPSDPGAYRVRFDITSTTPVAITNLVDIWNGDHVAEVQGQFSVAAPPALPTGSGSLDAGIWVGENTHLVLGLAGADLVVLMNPTTAALMTGQPFDNLINGIPPLAVPNPYPFTNAEAFVIDRITQRPAEWAYDIGTLFDPLYRPNALDPTLLIGSGGPVTGVLMSFTDGKVLGTVNVVLTPVPEPASLVLMLCGVGGLMLCRRAPKGE